MDVPCGANIHYHLEKYNDMNELEKRINQAIQMRPPPRIVNGEPAILNLENHCLSAFPFLDNSL